MGRPVKYIEDRREHFTATQTQRDQFWELEERTASSSSRPPATATPTWISTSTTKDGGSWTDAIRSSVNPER